MPGTPQPTGPKLTAKGRATRERIVETAAALIFEHGVAGMSIDDVRRTAGVSGSQISHYFDDKQALIRAVVQHEAGSVIEKQSPIIDHLDSFAALRTWAAGAVAMQRESTKPGGCTFGSLASELGKTDEDTRCDLADGFATWGGKIESGLRAMHERGELRADADPAKLALAVLAAVQGGLLLTQTMLDVAPLEASMDAVLTHVESFAAAPATV